MELFLGWEICRIILNSLSCTNAKELEAAYGPGAGTTGVLATSANGNGHAASAAASANPDSNMNCHSLLGWDFASFISPRTCAVLLQYISNNHALGMSAFKKYMALGQVEDSRSKWTDEEGVGEESVGVGESEDGNAGDADKKDKSKTDKKPVRCTTRQAGIEGDVQSIMITDLFFDYDAIYKNLKALEACDVASLPTSTKGSGGAGNGKGVW